MEDMLFACEKRTPDAQEYPFIDKRQPLDECRGKRATWKVHMNTFRTSNTTCTELVKAHDGYLSRVICIFPGDLLVTSAVSSLETFFMSRNRTSLPFFLRDARLTEKNRSRSNSEWSLRRNRLHSLD